MQRQTLFVVIPAYNEALNLPHLLTEIQTCKIHDTLIRMVVVDDGSSDQTAQVARMHGAYVVRHPFNLGIGATVQTGFRFALSHGADWVIQIDGDGQHMPSEITRLLVSAADGNPDIVIGSRFFQDVRQGIRASTLPRWTAGRVLSATIRLLTGLKITDCTSGFRLYNRNAAQVVASEYPDDYPEVEALVLFSQRKLNVREVPVKMRARQSGKSSITMGRAFYYMVKVMIACAVLKMQVRPHVQPY